MTKRSHTTKTAKPAAPAAPAVKRGRGRPLLYTRALAEAICDRMALGESLRGICRGVGLQPATVRSWAAKGRADGPKRRSA